MQPSKSRFHGARNYGPMLVLGLLCVSPEVSFSNPAVSGATAQITPNAADDQVSPPNAVTGPDYRALMKTMNRNLGACGLPRKAVLRLHVLPDGVIDQFLLQSSSGDACFDEIVILNAEEVVKANLRITPATRNGIAEAAWITMVVAVKD